MSDLAGKILANCYTKTAALVALSDLGQQVRARKISVEDYQKTKKEIESLEPLHLELALELNDAQLQQMVTKLRAEYGKNFLVEIETNPELIGGAKISYKGVQKDYSIYGNRLRQIG